VSEVAIASDTQDPELILARLSSSICRRSVPTAVGLVAAAISRDSKVWDHLSLAWPEPEENRLIDASFNVAIV
jgi:hypothetical protein